MEIPQKIKELIEASANIDKELNDLILAKTDAEMLMIAHQIRAKYEVKKDLAFDLMKTIKESE
jgi:hypothetical protein